MGLNEQEASSRNLDFGAVRVEYQRAVRGIVSGEKGFLKMLFAPPPAGFPRIFPTERLDLAVVKNRVTPKWVALGNGNMD